MAKNKKAPDATGSLSASTTALTISQQQGTGLSRQQQDFNRLVAKIEKLKQEREQTEKLLHEKLAYYGHHIHGLLEQEMELRTRYVKMLYKYFQQKKPVLFSKRQKEVLKDVMAAQLDQILSFKQEVPDETIQEIFKAVEGFSLEEAQAQELSDRKSEVEEVFREFGVDIDLDGLDKDMSPEEILKLLAETEEAFRKQAESSHQHNHTGKTARERAREEKEKILEEMKQKNVSSIYKQLVKIFHPDLEQDPEKKGEKEELMKQLTGAYEQHDMYTLLSLELAWIQKDQHHLHTLADDKLKLYNEVLREQVRNLESEIYMLGEHPRYQPLLKLADEQVRLKTLDVVEKRKERQEIVLHLEAFMNDFSQEDATAIQAVKDIIAMEEENRRLDSMWDQERWE